MHYRHWETHGDPLAGTFLRVLSPLQRLEAKVILGDPVRDLGRCLIFSGAPSSLRGFVKVDGRMRIPSRLGWELVYGPIPDGMYVCHHCDVPRCVRPSHWFLGTPLDNTTDMIEKVRNANQVKNECPVGHAYDSVNTYVWKDGSRHCRKCRARQQAEWRARRVA